MASNQCGSAGAGESAHEGARALQRELACLRARRGLLGRLFTALFPSEQERRLQRESRNYRTGAAGEQALADWIARRCPAALMLHDRRAPGTRGNIDHIAVAPSGVYVIDCKRYKGRIRVSRSLFSEPRLTVNGRDRTKLLDGLARQLVRVGCALGDHAAPLCGCLCFVAPEGFMADVELPIFRTLQIKGHPLYHRRSLVRQLNRSGPLTSTEIRQLHELLGRRFRPRPVARTARSPRRRSRGRSAEATRRRASRAPARAARRAAGAAASAFRLPARAPR